MIGIDVREVLLSMIGGEIFVEQGRRVNVGVIENIEPMEASICVTAKLDNTSDYFGYASEPEENESDGLPVVFIPHEANVVMTHGLLRFHFTTAGTSVMITLIPKDGLTF
ncbi:MAG: hypothetical protein WC027_03560 [Candidatus Paceibacterota bacterium]